MSDPHPPPELALWPPMVDEAADEGALWLRWLVRLRWVAIFAQIVTLSATFTVLWSPFLLVPLGAVIVVLALGNLRALRTLRSPDSVGEDVLLSQLLIDVMALTIYFLLAGGPNNPFAILYVIHVGMAAVMLRARLAAALTVAVLSCYALLHAFHLPLRWDNHSLAPTALNTIGHVSAFTITSVSVAVFVVGLSATLRRRSGELLRALERTARTDRLRSVGTLAAGAAHELNTPLSTIGLRARRVARRHPDDDTLRDVEIVQQQLDRCRRVVDQLLVGAGDPSASGIECVPAGVIVHEAIALWSKGSPIPVTVEDRSDGFEIEVPRVAFTQALINLLENAREAQEEIDRADPIRVSVDREADDAVIRVRDRGAGLEVSPDRIGDPFFTTKSTGTGLGVFVARAVAEGAGGGIRYSAGTDGGTVARWWFPAASRRSA